VAQKVRLRRQEETCLRTRDRKSGQVGRLWVSSSTKAAFEGDGKGQVVMCLCEGMRDFASEVEFALLWW